tara:strand:- start:133 stop:345 length:213 start_codon:yes stop_codon:yes gene_type:complete
MKLRKFLFGHLFRGNDDRASSIVPYLNWPTRSLGVISKIDAFRVIGWFLTVIADCNENRVVPERFQQIHE